MRPIFEQSRPEQSSSWLCTKKLQKIHEGRTAALTQASLSEVQVLLQKLEGKASLSITNGFCTSKALEP